MVGQILEGLGFEQLNSPYFDTIKIRVQNTAILRELTEKKGV